MKSGFILLAGVGLIAIGVYAGPAGQVLVLLGQCAVIFAALGWVFSNSR